MVVDGGDYCYRRRRLLEQLGYAVARSARVAARGFTAHGIGTGSFACAGSPRDPDWLRRA